MKVVRWPSSVEVEVSYRVYMVVAGVEMKRVMMRKMLKIERLLQLVHAIRYFMDYY